MNHRRTCSLAIVAFCVLALAACGGSNSTATPTDGEASPSTSTSDASATEGAGSPVTFTAEVWADNWFALYANGELVGEDSVPITTERSFNAETITFRATYPLTVAMITKDYKETDSGLEYIGTDRQQMGDGGFIAQITDTTTGQVVAATGADWRGLVIHRAPTNKECEQSADPETACQFEITDEPAEWTDAAFDDSAWTDATVYTAAAVGTKEGYDTITWDPSASLIWTSDLEADNTILWRETVAAP